MRNGRDILDEGDFIAYTMDGTIYKAVKVGNAIPGTPPDETPLAGYDNYDQGLSKGDAAFNATTKELDGDAGDKKVNKDAVVFVQYDGDGVTGNYGKKFMVTTGAELNAWKSNWGNNVYFLSNDTGLTYADIVYIQGAQDDILPGIKNNYGYITSAVTEGQDSEGVYSSFTIWDGSDSYNVIARKSISNLGATKGSAIKFEWDGENVVKDVTPVANTGAVVYSNGTQVRLADNLTSNGYDLADDVVIINVSTKDKAGVAGNAITTAAQTSNSGVYHYNCWYVYDSTNKEIDVLIIDVTSNKLDGVATLTVDLEP